jgi:CheY-like chemotaxis protein
MASATSISVQRRAAAAGAMTAPAARRILLIEDDRAFRRMATRMLEEAGFAVTEAADFAAALSAVDGPDQIDLMLTDIGMPAGTPHGFSIAAVARRHRRDLKVLYMTGDHDPEQFALCDRDALVLRKPFTAAELRRAIADALG